MFWDGMGLGVLGCTLREGFVLGPSLLCITISSREVRRRRQAGGERQCILRKYCTSVM